MDLGTKKTYKAANQLTCLLGRLALAISLVFRSSLIWCEFVVFVLGHGAEEDGWRWIGIGMRLSWPKVAFTGVRKST